ncbi:hypothetical protein KEM55_004994, partial [Ascosphaera atra]
ECRDLVEVRLEAIRLEVWDNRAVCLRAAYQLDDTVHKIANLSQQFRVVRINEGAPLKLGVSGLGAVLEQVVSPDVRGNAGFLGIVAKDTDTSRLAEFAVLIVQVLSRAEMSDLRPLIPRANLAAWEDNTVERNVILAQELIKLNILRVPPPLLPFRGIVGGDGWITDTGFKPHVEDFVIEALERNRHTPLHITGNAAILQALLQPGLSDDTAVLRPAPFLHGCLGPLLDFRLKLVETKMDVFRSLAHRRRTVELAAGLDQLKGIKQVAALVALISSGVIIVAAGAFTLDISIGQERAVRLAKRLLSSLLHEEAIVP